MNPNILFILMDNLGYGEVGCYGGGILRRAPTPNIDRLAREGTKLLNFNVEPQCTPSRSCVMTGRHSIRSGTHSVPLYRRAVRSGAVGGDHRKDPVRSRATRQGISASGIWATCKGRLADRPGLRRVVRHSRHNR